MSTRQTYWDAEVMDLVPAHDTYTEHALPGLLIHNRTGIIVSANHVGEFEQSKLFKVIHGRANDS